jgi:hypothetical protein
MASTQFKAPSIAPQALPGAEAPNGSMPSIATLREPTISARGNSVSAILRYKETSAIRVRGPVTGRRYDFSMTQPTQTVDPRDAAVLTRSGMFFRA